MTVSKRNDRDNRGDCRQGHATTQYNSTNNSMPKNKQSRVFTRLCLCSCKSNYFFFPLYSSETVNFARPLARRAANTRRPFFVAILSRKPCLFFLFLLEGWNVLFIVLYFYMFLVKYVVLPFSLQNYSFFLEWQSFESLIYTLFISFLFFGA